MRNILALVGAATLSFLVVGWYLGWYQISSLPSPNGKQSVHVDINSGKITEDVKKGVEKGTEIVDNLREKAKDGPQSPPASGPASNFFTPNPTGTNGPAKGLTPVGRDDDEGLGGNRLPRN
ncbi:MAG: hypothetical protein J2P46_04635 [Zavarzinella sp.]|nr:hypothetical protein [Zavarzinella sp.]